jgi:chemotaxis response regulator CheB
MPKEAIARGAVDHVVPLHRIAPEILRSLPAADKSDAVSAR